MDEVRVVAFSGADQQHICQIRETVFGQEQNISRALDLDGEDPHAWHALVFVDSQPVATGRILADGHIGRVAVLKSHRGKGMGAKVVNALAQFAQEQGYPRVFLGAQSHAVDFYHRLGFTACGDEFIEADILHVPMHKVLHHSV
ncbi:MAG: GNAT family N-acetyltransferase [Plesiomonas shigelloides]